MVTEQLTLQVATLCYKVRWLLKQLKTNVCICVLQGKMVTEELTPGFSCLLQGKKVTKQLTTGCCCLSQGKKVTEQLHRHIAAVSYMVEWLKDS